jgi:hypothetical protein
VNIISNQTLIKNYNLSIINQNVTNIITINSSSTTLPFAINSSTGAIYELFEADSAYFNVSLSGNSSVDWYIDGIAYTTTQTGTKHGVSIIP